MFGVTRLSHSKTMNFGEFAQNFDITSEQRAMNSPRGDDKIDLP
jgi:hypothetical protein